MAIVKGAGLVMKALIEEGEEDVASRMQELALSEGALPKHLHISLFTQSQDSRVLTNRSVIIRWNFIAKYQDSVGKWFFFHSLVQAIEPNSGGVMGDGE